MQICEKKTFSISDFSVENDINIMAITKTFLGTDTDQIVLNELITNLYEVVKDDV